jgi:hypothetical protein
VAFALQIWLTAIGFAIFARALNNAPATTGTTLAIWGGIAALIALFIGGLLASRLAGIEGTINGMWNGVVLWGLSFVILMVLASLGATGVLGAITGNVGATAPTGATPGTTATALGAAQTGAWWFVLFQFLGLLAAAAGGIVGARRLETTEQPINKLSDNLQKGCYNQLQQNLINSPHEVPIVGRLYNDGNALPVTQAYNGD